jgi:hypothetical protein
MEDLTLDEVWAAVDMALADRALGLSLRGAMRA